MISTKFITRYLHLHGRCLAVEKSLLATLRKKTGYTFTNCKKALEIHNNDIKQAEIWLKQQAQSLGWAKATKLEGRQTSQGLVAIAVNKKNAAIVEVNCETDFVARNKEFQHIVEEAARSSLGFIEQQPQSNQSITKLNLSTGQLKTLAASDGKSLADHLALMIGNVGENATLKRAVCLKAGDDVHVSCYAHPSGGEAPILLGKIVGLVALKQLSAQPVDLNTLGRELCQHIVGMNPSKIGSESDEPVANKDEETCLIHQEYLLDDSVSVKQILDENEVEVVAFERFECGESTEKNADQPLELMETCQ